MSKRTEQVSSELIHQISQIIEKEIELDGFLITITDISISPDLQMAHISITVLPDIKNKKAIKILNSRAKFIQQKLKSKIRFYTTPQLRFHIDAGDKRRRDISAVLDQIKDDLK